MSTKTCIIIMIAVCAIMILCPNPALAAGPAAPPGTGGWVTWITGTHTQVAVVLGSICFFAAVGAVGSIVMGNGHINGIAWSCIGAFFGCGILLAIDQIISALNS